MTSSVLRLLTDLLAKFIHLREVSDRCSSQGGRVLHQDDLPPVVGEAHHLARQLLSLDIIETSHGDPEQLHILSVSLSLLHYDSYCLLSYYWCSPVNVY